MLMILLERRVGICSGTNSQGLSNCQLLSPTRWCAVPAVHDWWLRNVVDPCLVSRLPENIDQHCLILERLGGVFVKWFVPAWCRSQAYNIKFMSFFFVLLPVMFTACTRPLANMLTAGELSVYSTSHHYIGSSWEVMMFAVLVCLLP